MASTTCSTFLMKGTGTTTITYDKLVDIKDFPDLGGAPELVDITTLSDKSKRSLSGIQETDALEFKANYDATDYTTLKALEGTKTPYAVWFGEDATGDPDGHDGKFSFEGTLSVFVTGGGVNEAREMTISIAPATEITFSAT